MKKVRDLLWGMGAARLMCVCFTTLLCAGSQSGKTSQTITIADWWVGTSGARLQAGTRTARRSEARLPG